MLSNSVSYAQLLETNNMLQALTDETYWLCVTRTTQESKLFPVPSYMLLSYLNAYYRYPTLLRKIEARMPAEQLGDRARQMGTKIDTLTMGWTLPGFYNLGREWLINMGLLRPEDAVEDTVYVMDFWKRFQLSYHRNDGHITNRDFGHRSQILPEHQLQVFQADLFAVEAGDRLHTAANKFMATVSQFQFLSHCECRIGICNQGPYKFGEKSELIVRDFMDLAECGLSLAGRGVGGGAVQQPDHPDGGEGYAFLPDGRLGQLRVRAGVQGGKHQPYRPLHLRPPDRGPAAGGNGQRRAAGGRVRPAARDLHRGDGQAVEAHRRLEPGGDDRGRRPGLLQHPEGPGASGRGLRAVRLVRHRRARRALHPLLNDEFGRDCLTELVGLVSLPSQQVNDYTMMQHSNLPKRMYTPIPYAILETGTYTRTSGPLYPGSHVLADKKGKWRTSRGDLTQAEYNQAARGFTPKLCQAPYIHFDETWVKYHHDDPEVDEMYRIAQAQSRNLKDRGAGLSRADVEKLRGDG